MLLASGCGADKLLQPSRASCRRFPVELTENGTRYTCELAAGSLTCRVGTSSTRTAVYPSLSAFVTEPRVPHRLQRLSFETASYGMLVSSATTTWSYRYDGQGRLLERVRTGWNGVLGGFPYDTTTFSQWDTLGRPTLGRLVRETSELLVTITYDDASRTMSWSNGESATLDPDGNVVHESWIFGSATFEREYVILRTQEACL